MLNNVDHYDIKVTDHLQYSPEVSKSVALIFPTEFQAIQKEFPILLTKIDQNKPYQAVALMGVKPNENLFLKNSNNKLTWDGRYVPAVIDRGPFITGFQESIDGSISTKVYVDVSSPSVNKSEGKNVFLPHGGNTPYLEHIVMVLDRINSGKTIGEAMFSMLESMNLIEPLTINIDLINGDKIEISSYSTINEDAFHQLSGEDLEKLNKLGYLSSIFFMIASLGNLKTLIQRANEMLKNEIA